MSVNFLQPEATIQNGAIFNFGDLELVIHHPVW